MKRVVNSSCSGGNRGRDVRERELEVEVEVDVESRFADTEDVLDSTNRLDVVLLDYVQESARDIARTGEEAHTVTVSGRPRCIHDGLVDCLDREHGFEVGIKV